MAVQAQAVVNLVWNSHLTTSESLTANRAAQAFNTGSNTFGYTLDSIKLHGLFFTGNTNTATLHEGSRTGTKVADFAGALADPTFSQGGIIMDYLSVELTPTTTTTLNPSTTYVIVTATAFGGGEWRTTTSNWQRSHSTGGSIADTSEIYRTSTSSWATYQDTRKITVRGVVNTPPENVRPTAADSTVSTPANRAYTFTAGDFNFADRNPGDRLERVIFLNSPEAGKGTLRFGNRILPNGITASKRQLDRGLITYNPQRGASGDGAASLKFFVHDGELSSSEGHVIDDAYTMTVNVTPAENPVVTGDVLVSNIGQPTHERTNEAGGGTYVAQTFVTGGHSDGYNLTDIVVHIAQGTTASPYFTLHAGAGTGTAAKPGTVVTGLPGSVATSGLQTFTPTSTVKLTANTAYVVVFSSLGTPIALTSTYSGRDDVGEEPDWRIAPYGRTSSNIAFPEGSRASESVKMAVRGTRVSSGGGGGGGPGRGDPTEVAFHGVPEHHDGETAFTLTVAFSGAPDGLSPKRDASSALEVTRGVVTKARQAPRQAPGTWEVTVTPSGAGEVTVRVPARACEEAHAVCIDGRALDEAAEVRIAGTATTMSARITAAPTAHDGSESFELDLKFSHGPQGLGYRTVRDDLFDVTGGRIERAQRLTSGENLGWRLMVQPDGDDAVTVSARATTDCDAAYAVCDAEGRMFDGGLEHTVPGPRATALPRVSIAAGETPVSEGTDLVFTLSRTGATSSTLTVAVSVSETGAVLDSASPTSVAFASGATSATLRLATLDDDVVEEASTVTVTLSSASGYVVDANAGSAEGVVESEDVQSITARFTQAPDEHDGSSAFVLQLAFSHAPAGYSYVTVRDALFDVTGGTIEKARRLVKGSNLGWEVRLAPDGFGDVTLSARATTDCAAAHAACDAAGRKFDGSLSATIQGPATLSVADATVEEAEGATLDFVVSLSRARSQSTTVDYATSDGSARAGEDYTETSGTLTFAANETSKTVQVPVLDDVHDEGSETMTLTLSNATGGVVENAHGTGTITNTDPMPKAWMVRFGRTVGGQVVDAVTARLDGNGGSHVTIGGVPLMGEPGGMPEDEGDDPFGLPDWATKSTLEPDARTITADDLLLRSNFHLSSRGDGAYAGPAVTAWGRVATGGFETEEDGVTMDGDVTTAMIGFDAEWERALAGVMLAQSRGKGSYQLDPELGEDTGTVESDLTGVYPYARLELNAKVSAWALAGAGSGELTLKSEGKRAMPTDITLKMGAVGVKGQVLDGSGPSAVALNVKSDAMWVSTKSARTRDMVATEGDVTRLRLIVQGERVFASETGATFTPSAEMGLRHDGGDAETGTGLEVGAGLRYTAGRVSIEGQVRALVAHEAEGYEEWGASGAIRVNPSASGRGLTLSIAPQWGRTGSGTEQLWNARDASALEPDAEFEPTRQLVMDAGYGIGLGAGRGMLTPYSGMTLGEASSRTVRGGLRWKLGADAVLGLEATRQSSEGGETSDEVRFRAALRF